MHTRTRFIRFSWLMTAMSSMVTCFGEDPTPLLPPKNFQTSQLVAWCIVPFDAAKRDAEERSSMVRRLGLRRVAYDWRAEHVPKFEAEILAYQKHGIEFFAFWSWHDDMEALIKKHNIQPQIWKICKTSSGGSDEVRVASAVQELIPLVDKTRTLDLKLGIYNHGGWSGEPANMVAICEALRRDHAADHVGIVYNFHHGHEHVDAFASHLQIMLPYLVCVNLNGMMDADTMNNEPNKNKILPIGTGQHEQEMIQTLMNSEYRGPIGIIGHRQEMDVEQVLRENIVGLTHIVEELAARTD